MHLILNLEAAVITARRNRYGEVYFFLEWSFFPMAPFPEISEGRRLLKYIKKCLHIYAWNMLQWVNKRILKTYPLIEDCARCYDCGRNVHDFGVPDTGKK